MTTTNLKSDLPAIQLSDSEFHKLDGAYFHADWYDTSQTNANVLYMLFKTPATKAVHLCIDWYCKAGGYMTLNEGVTWTHTATNQTTVNIICDRRVNAQTSGILNKHAQTDFNAGSKIGVGTPQSLVNTTEILREYIYGTQPKMVKMKNEDFILLAKSTNYSIVVTTTAPSNASQVRMRWRESQFDDTVR